LTGIYTKAFVQGLQGNTDNENGRIQVTAACKHFVANSLEDWQGHPRHNFDTHISLQDLHTYYLNAQGVMCSYNAVNGIPSCTNKWLLKDVLRDAYNCGALDDVVRGYHHAIDAAQVLALAMDATVDVNCGNPMGKLAATMYPSSFVNNLPLTEMGLQVGVEARPNLPFGMECRIVRGIWNGRPHEHKLDLALWDMGPPIKVKVGVVNTGLPDLEGSQV
jgi:hypothetical protein